MQLTSGGSSAVGIAVLVAGLLCQWRLGMVLLGCPGELRLGDVSLSDSAVPAVLAGAGSVELLVLVHGLFLDSVDSDVVAVLV